MDGGVFDNENAKRIGSKRCEKLWGVRCSDGGLVAWETPKLRGHHRTHLQEIPRLRSHRIHQQHPEDQGTRASLMTGALLVVTRLRLSPVVSPLCSFLSCAIGPNLGNFRCRWWSLRAHNRLDRRVLRHSPPPQGQGEKFPTIQ